MIYLEEEFREPVMNLNIMMKLVKNTLMIDFYHKK